MQIRSYHPAIIARLLALIIWMFLIMIRPATADVLSESPNEPQWQHGVTICESPDELLPLFASPASTSVTRGGYFAGVTLWFSENEEGVPLVPVIIGPLDDPSSMRGYMERGRIIAYTPGDLDADRPVPYARTLIVMETEPGWINLRQLPTETAPVVEQVLSGSIVNVLGMVSEWLHIETGGVTGYTQTQHLTPLSAARVLTTDEFSFGLEELQITIQLLTTGDAYPGLHAIRVLDYNHDIIQTIPVLTVGRLDRDAHFILEDMNFDGYPDFRVLSNYSDNQYACTYYLFDPGYSQNDTPSWRFVRADAFDALHNEPTFDALNKRIYTRHETGGDDQPTYIDSVYDLVGDVPRLIESLWSTNISQTEVLYKLYGLQGESFSLIHEWTVNLDKTSDADSTSG